MERATVISRKTRNSVVVGGPGPRGAAYQDNRTSVLQRNNTGLPDTLKSGIENLSGHSMDDVKVHYNSSKPAQLNAHAYAQGTDIHLGSGQEKHLPHEAWHVVQQKQGRVQPTTQLREKVNINDDIGLEKEADEMGEKALKDEFSLGETGIKRNTSTPVGISQLRRKEAARYIHQNELDVTIGYNTILEYIRNINNPQNHREGLRTAWNHLQSAHFEISKEPSSEETGTATKAYLEKVASKALAKGKEPKVKVANFQTMYGLFTSLGVDLTKYKVPLSLNGAQKMRQEIDKFNHKIDALSSEDIYSDSFNVDVNVSNLKGYGDVMAGAKLAKELATFYHRFETWKNVNVRIYLAKVEALKEKLPTNEDERKESAVQKEIDKIVAMVKSILSGANVSIHGIDDQISDKTEIDDDSSTSEDGQSKVEVAYPISRMDSDVNVSQYGHDRFGQYGTYGSGPGYGSLGTLPVPVGKQVDAMANLGQGTSPVINAINQLEESHGISHFHFGYFSIYEKRPKAFAKTVAAESKGNAIGIAIAKSQDSARGMASSLSQDGFNVFIYEIGKDGKIKNLGKEVAKKSNGKTVVIIDLPQGVENLDMLSLYLKSAAPVGATGDQSLMEAYTMRKLRSHLIAKEDEQTPDILYDVSEQQTKLYHHLGELSDHTIAREKEASGLKPLKLREDVDDIVLQKNLLFPVLMLINEALQDKI